MPAMPQAAATEIEPLPPLASASKNTPGVITTSFFSIEIRQEATPTSSRSVEATAGSGTNRYTSSAAQPIAENAGLRSKFAAATAKMMATAAEKAIVRVPEETR